MVKRKARVKDDSVTVPGAGVPEAAGKSHGPHGEAERAEEGPEPGREDGPPKGPARRPTGKSKARDTTSIDPQDPIDPRSPNLR